MGLLEACFTVGPASTAAGRLTPPGPGSSLLLCPGLPTHALQPEFNLRKPPAYNYDFMLLGEGLGRNARRPGCLPTQPRLVCLLLPVRLLKQLRLVRR